MESKAVLEALARKSEARNECPPRLPSDEILRLVASAERGSEHPLAKVLYLAPSCPFDVGRTNRHVRWASKILRTLRAEAPEVLA